MFEEGTLTRKELAELYGVTERCVDLWRAKGMPHVKVRGHYIRFYPAAVAAWLNNRKWK
jgi:excisionase family DNA binding protein